MSTAPIRQFDIVSPRLPSNAAAGKLPAVIFLSVRNITLYSSSSLMIQISDYFYTIAHSPIDCQVLLLQNTFGFRLPLCQPFPFSQILLHFRSQRHMSPLGIQSIQPHIPIGLVIRARGQTHSDWHQQKFLLSINGNLRPRWLPICTAISLLCCCSTALLLRR